MRAKRILLSLVSVSVNAALLLCALCVGSFAAVYGELTYETQNGEVTITDCAPPAKSVTVPEYLGGCPVTAIDSSAFADCSALESVTLPDTVKSVGGFAFSNCVSLTSVSLGGVESLSMGAFSCCSALKSITLPESLTSVGSYAFDECSSLESVIYGGGIEEWMSIYFNYGWNPGADIYLGGEKLTEAVLPDGMTGVFGYALSGCAGLVSVSLPASLESMEYCAFDGCEDLESIYFRGTLEQWLGIAFGDMWNPGADLYFDGEKASSLTLPDSVSVIEGYALAGCTSLESVICPDSLTQIGNTSFYGCTNLKSVALSDSLTQIGQQSFEGCANLKSVSLPASLESVGWNAFYGCTLDNVYYEGDETQWSEVYVDSSNEGLLSAPVTFSHVHDYVAESREPTCAETGLTEGIKCSVCGEIIKAQQEISALGHKYEAAITPPDCTHSGYTTYTCSVCGDEYTSDETEALGHSYEAAVTPPDCTHSGYTTYTCSVCGDEYTSDETEALGHSYEAAVTPPDCTQSGYTTYTCSVCGDEYTSDETEALGHSFGEWTTVNAPTYSEDGLEERVCSVCGESESRAIERLTALIGDTNGDGKVTASDARLALRASARLETPTEHILAAADFDKNGKISASEARKILRVSAKLEQF